MSETRSSVDYRKSELFGQLSGLLDQHFNQGKGAIAKEDRIVLIDRGTSDMDKRIAEIKEGILKKYGTLEKLVILKTSIPEPDPKSQGG